MSTIAATLATAIQLHQAGQLVAAEQLYRQVLQQQPEQPNVLYLLGLVAQQTGQVTNAIAWYQRALVVQPNFVDAHINLGAAWQQQGKLTTAIEHYHAALRLQPDNPHALINLGTTLQQQGNLTAAIGRYQTAIQLQPNLPEAHSNLGHAYKERGDLAQAIAHYQTALQLSPNHPAAYRDLGDALQDQGNIAAAIALYDRAIGQFPQHVKLRGSRIRALLISGDLQRGFAEYDQWRLGMASTPRSFSQPAWDGSPLSGQPILLYAEAGSGLGDTMQFIRYVPLVLQRGGQVIIECQPPLVRLFQTLPGVKQVIALGEPLPEFAVQASVLSLPHIFSTTLTSIPATIPYLLPPDDRFPLPPCPSSTLKVGLVWGGDPKHSHDRQRSCSIKELLPIVQIPHVAFYSLQIGEHRHELTDQLPIQDLSSHLQDFADTAAAIAQLDLVISVDTSVAHLAGAMGKPVWLLLSAAPDWRWLLQRQDSPWYPSAQLFRQSRYNHWSSVCQDVAVALKSLVDRYQRSQ
ncbi:tetratricopeptide repeat protein [Pantanalinema sp. GBBB05]|uniref:tetratricopeptide repeat protein n=1 Tax=Pantanalinema sp. GBBB05 TaxID=2604139 RepID=UPI001D7846E9|nr:tetratricopeptide repeat protein [Pantanalinema sp. GBBB05]